MSADSWTLCPICHNRPSEYPQGISHLYGKITVDAFAKLKACIDARSAEETVRGDYEVVLGADGFVEVWLRFKCLNCGAVWEYKKDNIPHRLGATPL